MEEKVVRKRKLSGDFELTEIATKSNREKESASSELYNDRTVYVEGLPFTATDDDVREFFKLCGTITHLRLARWHDTGRLRGFVTRLFRILLRFFIFRFII